MSTTDIIYWIADFIEWTFGLFEFIGNYINDFILIFGFFGFFYWMSHQIRYNKKAKNNPNQIK
tara:strand:- start:1285 stop:1473 length:189 start_codon:yes stop_codon:yes gene_type:complete